MKGPFASSALQYAERGLFPVPVQYRDKNTLVGWKTRQQTGVSPREVEQWTKKYPGANIGLLTGVPSPYYDGRRLIVFDVDSRDGFDYLKRYGVPRTATVQTGREGGGGRHYYLLTKTAIPIEYPAPGLEIRGAKAYVLAPASIHPETGNPYKWLRPLDDIRDMPDGLLNLALERRRRERRHRNGTLRDGLHGVREGTRKTTAVRIAGLLTQQGFTDEGIRTFLLAWNQQNSPPWPDDEAQTRIDDILRSAAQWRKNPVPVPSLITVDMSKHALPQAIFQQTPPAALKVYLVLGMRQERFGPNFQVSISTLQRQTGLSRPWVIRALRYLLRHRLVNRTYRGFRTLRGDFSLPSRYVVLPPEVTRWTQPLDLQS